MSYFQDIQDGIRTTLKGLSLTLKHLRNATQRRTPVGVASDNYFELQNGLVTLQYPHEQLPIPDNGRYRLYNEIDDCIVCDKCAKVCPVDCITIDAIKATEEVGRASDGSPIRLYAAKFDIDMAKCCYCGLCTVVCPTECLTMEKTFDYSEFELGKLTYHFADLTPEEADQKRAFYEQFVREKEELKAQQAAAKATQPPATSTDQVTEAAPATKRPVFRPSAKPTATSQPEQPKPTAVEPVRAKSSEAESTTPPATPKRPVFKPTLKPAAKTETPAEPKTTTTSDDTPEQDQPTETTAEAKPTAAKPAFRPSMKPKVTVELPANSEDKEQKKPLEKRNSVGSALEHPVTDATPDEAGKIALEARDEAIEKGEVQQTATDTPRPRPAFRPTMKPAQPVAAKPEPPSTDQSAATPETMAADAPKTKPAFRPSMKPKAAQSNEPQASASEQASFKPEEPTSQLGGAQEASVETAPKPKPAFRPTMKPKPDQASDDSGEPV